MYNVLTNIKEDQMPELYYSITELEKITGLSRRTIHFYIAQGLIPPPEETEHESQSAIAAEETQARRKLPRCPIHTGSKRAHANDLAGSRPL